MPLELTEARPVSGPVFMRLFGFRLVGPQSRWASSFRAMNVASANCRSMAQNMSMGQTAGAAVALSVQKN